MVRRYASRNRAANFGRSKLRPYETNRPRYKSQVTAVLKPLFSFREYSQRGVAWRRGDVFAYLLLLAAACFATGGGAMFWGDTGLQFQPLLELQRAALRDGELALWNPFLLCGTPLVGNPQAWVFYPPAWPLALFSTTVLLAALNALHVFLGGAFTFAFLRRGALKLDVVPSLLGASAFMLGGYFFTKTTFPNMAAALCWLPLLLLFTERVVRRPSLRGALPLGVALAMQIAAAHAQITVFTIYLLSLYGLWWLNVTRRRAPRVLARRLARACGAALAAFALALALSCAQWLPVIDFLRATKRTGLTLREAHLFYLPLEELTNFFWPYRFGDPRIGVWNGYGTIVETSLYLGIVPCVLALLAIYRIFRAVPLTKNSASRRSVFAKKERETAPLSIAARREKAARFWFFIALCSVILALGAGALLYLLAWFLVPGVRAFRNPARMLMAASLALPILAALGAQQLLASRKTSRARALLGAVLVAATLLDLGFYARNFFPKRPFATVGNSANAPLQTIQKDVVMQSEQGRIFMPDAYASWESFTDPATFGENSAHRYAQWQSTLTPNLGELHRLREAGGYDPVADRAMKSLTVSSGDLLTKENPTPREIRAVHNALRVLAVRYLVLFRQSPPNFPALTPVFRGPILSPRGERTFVVRNDDFAPRLRWLKSDRTAANLVTTREYSRHQNAPSRILQKPQTRAADASHAAGKRAAGKVRQVRDGDFAKIAAPNLSAPHHVAPRVLATRDFSRQQGAEKSAAPRFVRDEFNEIEIEIAPQNRARTLLLADSFRPGWQLFVDGRAQPIERRGLFRAVKIAPSKRAQRAVFVYRPQSFVFGIFVSLCALFAVAFSLCARRKRAC